MRSSIWDVVYDGGRYAPATYASTGDPPAGWPGGSSDDSLAYSLYATLDSGTGGTAPSNTAVPAITGTAAEGQVLAASAGTWTNAPTSFTYLWHSCDSGGANCAAIGGATSSTYTLVAADAGKTLRVVVTATNAAGSAAASSVQTAVVQAAPAPTTLGKTAVGGLTHAPGGNYPGGVGSVHVGFGASVSKLSAYVQGGGSATAMRAVIYADSGNQPGAFVAVSQQVTVAAGQAAGWVDFPVSGSPTLPAGQYWLGLWASNTSALGYYDSVASGGRYAPSTYSAGSNPPASWPGGGSFDSLAYSLYATLGAPPSAPANTALPAVSGTATQGQVLSSTTGTWSNNPSGFAYQWRRCNAGGTGCADIAGATNSTYTLVAADVTNTLRVVVTATNGGGSTAATSAQTAVVQAAPTAPANTGLPAVSGAATEGQQLSTTNGSWTGSPSGFAYQWQRCDNAGANCSNIAGAIGSTYTLVSGDVGKTLRVVVTATNAGGSTPATSSATAVVQAVPTPPANTALPAISGTATEGQVLSGSNGSWTGSPSGFAYQWHSCDGAGANCAAIGGATNSTYTLVGGDVGKTIRVVVTATNAAGSTPAVSNQTAVVQAAPTPPANTALPAITGTSTEGQQLSTTNGSWTGSPSGFAYQWQRCDNAGANCSNIGGATGSTYTLVSGDVGKTLRVVVTATNAGGSTPATSNQTALVQAAPAPTTLGKTAVGALTHALGGNYLEASGRYTLASSSSVSKLSAYVQGGGSATAMRAVIYADSGNQPGAFVAVSQQVTVAAGQAAGWVDFPVSGSPTLPAGQYWLGLWASNTSALGYYDSVASGGRYAPSTYSAGSNPPASWPGGGSFDSLAYSLYATLGAPPSAPANTALPAVSGTATQGQVLSSTTGTLVEQSVWFCLPVAALQRGGDGLRRYRRCDQLDLHVGRC